MQTKIVFLLSLFVASKINELDRYGVGSALLSCRLFHFFFISIGFFVKRFMHYLNSIENDE